MSGGNMVSRRGAAIEIRMRAWAETNAAAARALADIDRRRQGYIERMLVAAGVAPALAAIRTQILYWTYLGAALSRRRLAGARLDRIVTELKAIGLGGRGKGLDYRRAPRRNWQS